jgi:hypothetical protein
MRNATTRLHSRHEAQRTTFAELKRQADYDIPEIGFLYRMLDFPKPLSYHIGW